MWTHLAVTLSGATGTLYVNGKAVATNTAMTLNPSSLPTTTGNYIGHSQFPPDPYLDATVDEFQAWNRALSAAEVQSLLTSAGSTAGGGNVVWYRFDEARGDVAIDSSGSNRNGTIAPVAGIEILSGPSPQTGNTLADPDAVVPSRAVLHGTHGVFSYKAPASSLTVVTVADHRGRM